MAAVQTTLFDDQWPVEIPKGCPVPPSWPPASDWWDAVVVLFSGGIDSHAMLLKAAETYPEGRVLAVFNDTGDDHSPDNRLVDFPGGTRGFVQAECEALGIPLVITEGPAILDHTGARGRWADSRNRYCTSDIKRSPTDKVLRNLGLDKRRILVMSGELAEESPARARKPEWQLRVGATAPTKGRLVFWQRPMLHWHKEDEVLYIWSKGREIAPSYYGGWDRLSCRFCFFLTFERQVLSFVAYPAEAARFVALEDRMQHWVSLNYKWGEYKGYRAVWEATWGPWTGEIPTGKPSDYAQGVVEQLHGEARRVLTALREGKPARWKRCGGCA